MSADVLLWLKAGHVISVILWIGGLFAIYWMLRMHAHAPKDVLEQFTLMERSIALSTDIAATVAIGCGVGLIFQSTPNLLALPGHAWLHIKLTVVVLGLLSMHGMLRGKIKRFGQGKISPIGGWMWSVILASVTVIVILVFRGPLMFAPKPEGVPAVTPATAPAATPATPTTPAK